jgi:hypothetical protein
MKKNKVEFVDRRKHNKTRLKRLRSWREGGSQIRIRTTVHRFGVDSFVFSVHVYVLACIIDCFEKNEKKRRRKEGWTIEKKRIEGLILWIERKMFWRNFMSVSRVWGRNKKETQIQPMGLTDPALTHAHQSIP